MATSHPPLPLSPTSWLTTLTTPSFIKENHSHYWGNDPSALRTTSHPLTLSLGTGLSLHQTALLPALEAAEHEVLFVTCFWARSASLSHLHSSLLLLSRKALARNDGSKIRVRIGFSSRSLLQKLFHTQASGGYVYRPEEWATKLGLPPPEQLRGLDVEVRSKFFRPFSVIHPKFLVVDRRRAFMPSCNVSWETWLECCISLEGPVVSNLVEFWTHFWGQGKLPALQRLSSQSSAGNSELPDATPTPSSTSLPTNIPLPPHPLETILLPSPHHNSLSLSIPFPLLHPQPPATPLNTLLLHLFSTATTSLNILTPNLTSAPVITALLTALACGVDVSIITNRRMMLLEQLVTAGTVTELCVWGLVRRYKRLVQRAAGGGREGRREGGDEVAITMEEGRASVRGGVGRLEVGYYRPHPRPGDRDAEPVKSHVKCTVVDGEVVVLGSGNMDRASWFTSQELGIAFYGKEVVGAIWGSLEGALGGRVEGYFEG